MRGFAFVVALAAFAATVSAQTNVVSSETNQPERKLVLSATPHEMEGPANLTVVTTRHVLVSGTLVRRSATNLVLSSAGLNIEIPLGEIKWCETNLTIAGTPSPKAPATKVSPTATGSSAAVIAEFSKPHSEEEMRALLKTPEAQALIKSIADARIGPEGNSQTSPARDAYFSMVQQFASGSLSITDIQDQAQGLLGQAGQYDKELQNGPLADEWKEYREILQGFLSEPAPKSAVTDKK